MNRDVLRWENQNLLHRCRYLGSQVQNQVFDHLSKRFGERQNLVTKVVPPPEAHDVDDPHALQGETAEPSPTRTNMAVGGLG